MLADAINLPLVGAFGLAVFGPLTLLVTVIECLIFKLLLRVRFRAVFKRILVANIASTLAGGIVLGFQDAFIRSAGITSSIPAFVHGYEWVSILLVLVYYAKSAVVESVVVATRHFAARIERSRWSIVKAVVFGNVASYLVVGPLFVLTTRPTFGHLEVTTDTSWTANPDQAVYFIGPSDHFIDRVNTSGKGLTTVVPYAAADFLISGDETAFAYRDTDGNLYAYRTGDAAPTLVWRTEKRFLMRSVSLSADNQRIAYVAGRDVNNEGYSTEYRLNVFEIASCQTSRVYDFPFPAVQWPVVSWSHDGSFIYALQDPKNVSVYRSAPPYGLVALKSPSAVQPAEVVENYADSSYRWQCVRDDDSGGDVTVTCWQGFGAHLAVERDKQTVLRVANDYGLLKLGLPGPDSPSFLANGSEVLVEWWGQIYLLDFEHRRMSLLVDGGNYVLPTESFRVRLE
jgi:hypothetical protein